MLLGNQSFTTRNPLTNWRREMNQLINRFDQEFGTFSLDSNDFMPNIEIKEKEKSYLVSAEVPGMKESDISVTLRDNNLILEGERQSELTDEKEGYCSSEFSYGSFYRAIPLENEVNADTVKASYKDGVLTVRLDKVKAVQHVSKKIPVLKS